MKHTFSKGDYVQLLHTDQVGEIIAIRDGQATISFDYITLTAPLAELKPIADKDLVSHTTSFTGSRKFSANTFDMYKFLSFQPELDLHGLSIDEALRILDKWLDQALLAGHRHVKIIHGKGKGLLRQEIHQYLRKQEIVKKMIVNHTLPGGSGVTLVEL
jgi:DNA mismatch repair protein MutS2